MRSIYLLLLFLFVISSCQKRAVQPKTKILAPEYSALAEKLSAIIQSEMEIKGIRAVSIALVHDQEVLYAEGFGYQDDAKKMPADMNSIYRIGSVSKMFTDIAIMQEMEKGRLDIDATINDYLPEFQPANPFDKKITLRQLMAHRAGLVREPPVGHYFDDQEPSLRATVESLNNTQLVYEPETRTKYSNAGIAVVGYVLEYLNEQAFEDYLRDNILEPLQMTSSSFEFNPDFKDRLVEGDMWTYDGRVFSAPTFPLGMAPAGSMYSSVADLASFMKMLFRGGTLNNGEPLISEESIRTMWTPQFAEGGSEYGYGLGFSVGKLNDLKLVGHGGAIYGFSTEMMLLPGENIGVVIIAGKDFTNSVMDRIGEFALEGMLAVRENNALPEWKETTPVGRELTRKMAGRYGTKEDYLDLVARGDRLYQEGRSYKMELRKQEGDTLTVDDCLGHGDQLFLTADGSLSRGGTVLPKIDIEKPAPLPAAQKELIGEYGWDYNTLYILERRGQLHALIEWFPMYPITQVEEDIYAFPGSYGLYHGEKLEFVRDENGEVNGVKAAGILFKRRLQDIEEGKTFQITPVKPTEELRSVALSASPPDEEGDFKAPDLVDLASLDSSIRYDIRYSSNNNFMGVPFYQQSKAYMQRPAAEAVVRIHQKLKEKGYGLMIHDAYRPWYVTKMFWDATPEQYKHFVANPERGSRHNRGCAVDLTMYHLQTGGVIEAVGGYDEFSDRSYPDYPGGTSLQRYYREMLREAMEADGFDVYQWEWWHFDFKDWRSYPILDQTFEELE